MSEQDDVLDNLETQFDQLRSDSPIEDDKAIEDEPAPVETDDLPGYLTYDEWVAEGKDPDEYKGKKAYSAEYDRIQDAKKTQKELREMKDTLRTVNESVSEWKEHQYAQMRAEVEQELASAKESEDVDRVIAAKDKLTELDAKPAKSTPALNPAVSEFIVSTPILDKGSDEFNPKAMRQMERIYNNKLRQLDDGTGNFHQDDIQSCLKAAFGEVKSLNPELFESPRNSRAASIKPKASRPSPETTPAQKMKSVNVVRNNPRDQNAAQDIFDLIASKDPKAAERFANAAHLIGHAVGDNQ